MNLMGLLDQPMYIKVVSQYFYCQTNFKQSITNNPNQLKAHGSVKPFPKPFLSHSIKHSP